MVLPVALGLLAVNRSVVDLMVPENYRAITYLVLPFSTVGGLLRYLRAHTTDQVFLIHSRPGFITAISTVDLLCAVVSSYVGLRTFGIAGAAAGPMVSGFATYTASMVMSWTVLGFRPPVMSFVAIGSSAALMALVVYALPPGPGLLGLALRVVLGVIIYAAAIVAVLPIGRQVAFSTAQRLVARFT